MTACECPVGYSDLLDVSFDLGLCKCDILVDGRCAYYIASLVLGCIGVLSTAVKLHRAHRSRAGHEAYKRALTFGLCYSIASMCLQVHRLTVFRYDSFYFVLCYMTYSLMWATVAMTLRFFCYLVAPYRGDQIRPTLAPEDFIWIFTLGREATMLSGFFGDIGFGGTLYAINGIPQALYGGYCCYRIHRLASAALERKDDAVVTGRARGVLTAVCTISQRISLIGVIVSIGFAIGLGFTFVDRGIFRFMYLVQDLILPFIFLLVMGFSSLAPPKPGAGVHVESNSSLKLYLWRNIYRHSGASKSSPSLTTHPLLSIPPNITLSSASALYLDVTVARPLRMSSLSPLGTNESGGQLNLSFAHEMLMRHLNLSTQDQPSEFPGGVCLFDSRTPSKASKVPVQSEPDFAVPSIADLVALAATYTSAQHPAPETIEGKPSQLLAADWILNHIHPSLLRQSLSEERRRDSIFNAYAEHLLTIPHEDIHTFLSSIFSQNEHLFTLCVIFVVDSLPAPDGDSSANGGLTLGTADQSGSSNQGHNAAGSGHSEVINLIIKPEGRVLGDGDGVPS